MNPEEQPTPWIDAKGEAGLASILIPAFNAQETIVATLDSVAKQTYRPVEVILINDGSTDQTDSLIQNWIKSIGQQAGMTVHYFRQANEGLLACRNRSTLESRGELIQYLDADDLLHPDKLKAAVAVMEQDLSMDVVISRTLKFKQDQDIVECLRASPVVQPWSNRETGAPTIARAFWFTPGPVFRRRAVAAAGPFPPDVDPVAEEMEFHARIKCTAKNLFYLPEILAFHRIEHSSQLTRQLPRLYQGKVDGARWVVKTMEEFGIADRKEWHGLIKNLASTGYAIASCSHDQALVDDVYGLLKNLSRRHWPMMLWMLQLLGPVVWVKLCRMVYGVRKLANA